MSYENTKKYKKQNKDKIKRLTFEFHEKDFDLIERFMSVNESTKNLKLRKLLNHFDTFVDNQIENFELKPQSEKKSNVPNQVQIKIQNNLF